MARHDANVRHDTGHPPQSGGMGESGSAERTRTQEDASRTVKEASREFADRAREVKDQIAGQVQDITGGATQQAKTMLDQRKAMASDALGGVAQALRHTAGQLGERPMMAEYAERAADRVESFSRQIAEKDLGQIVRDAENLGRRQPEALIGGAVAAGFLFARFVKATRLSAEPRPSTADSPHGFERAPVRTSDG